VNGNEVIVAVAAVASAVFLLFVLTLFFHPGSGSRHS
jgi:hypothetical protein